MAFKHPSTNSGNQYTPKARVFETEMKEKERKKVERREEAREVQEKIILTA